MNYLNSLSPYMMDLIAATQGEIFMHAEDLGYDMNDFITKYMNSDFCNNEMDSECSDFHFKQDTVCVPYIEKEISAQKSSENKFNDVRFVGMVYRYLVFMMNISSKKLITLLSPKELDNMAAYYDCYEISDAAKDIITRFFTI